MGASISANHGTHCFINSKRGDSHPKHNSNPTFTRTYIHPPPSTTCWTSNCPARAHHFLLALPLPRSKPNQVYISRTILPLTYFIRLPMKMVLIVSSETSAIRTQTPGNYPKRNKLHLEHGESLKTRQNYAKGLINTDVTNSSVYLDCLSTPNFKKCAVKNE